MKSLIPEHLFILIVFMFCAVPVLSEDAFAVENENLISFGSHAGFKTSIDRSKAGIDVYTLQKNSKVYISYYVGNDLNFPVRVVKQGHKTRILRLNGVIEIISEWNGDNLVGRELLFSTGREWPSKVIVWTGSSLTQSELKEAEEILFSLDVRLVREWSP